MGREAARRGQLLRDACQWAIAEWDASAGALRVVVSDGCRALLGHRVADVEKWVVPVPDVRGRAARQSADRLPERNALALCTRDEDRFGGQSCAVERWSGEPAHSVRRALARRIGLQLAAWPLPGRKLEPRVAELEQQQPLWAWRVAQVR